MTTVLVFNEEEGDMAGGKMNSAWRLLMALMIVLLAACSSGGGGSPATDTESGTAAEDGNASSDDAAMDATPETAMVDSGFEVVAQGDAPAGVACFAMIFKFYRDQGAYVDNRTGAVVPLDETIGTSIAQGSQVWNWINAGVATVTTQQLYEAAYHLNDETGKARYFVKLHRQTSPASDTATRVQQLAYITRNFLKHNRPVIIEMMPANPLLNTPFHLVLLGYDSAGRTITYACPRDGGSKATTSYTDFIENYFYRAGTYQRARWDGAWLGFYHGAALAGDHRQCFEQDGYDRAYELHVPAAYTGSSARPLIVDFHGIYQSAAVERKTSGFMALSETEGFIVAYPEGIETLLQSGLGAGQSWNADTTGMQWYSWANLSNVDDLAFAVAVVDDVKRQLNIDADRVYVTGLSQGGAMALLCAHERGDVFAAAAVVSAALLKQLADYHPLRPVPVANFHSYDDTTVPYYGNFLIGLPPIEEAARRWAVVNGCESADPTVSVLGYPDSDHPDVPEKLTVYPGGAEVRLYSLHSSSDDGDPHDLYRTNLHGRTVKDRQRYIANLAWEFLERFTLS